MLGTEYKTVAASQSDSPLSGVGASAGKTGDILIGVTIVPATTSPGAVSIKDGSGASITIFAGGASSVLTLHPFYVPLGVVSQAGGWSVTTGANVSVIAVGDFR